MITEDMDTLTLCSSSQSAVENGKKTAFKILVFHLDELPSQIKKVQCWVSWNYHLFFCCIQLASWILQIETNWKFQYGLVHGTNNVCENN